MARLPDQCLWRVWTHYTDVSLVNETSPTPNPAGTRSHFCLRRSWLDGTRACFHGDPVWRKMQLTIKEGHSRILQMGCTGVHQTEEPIQEKQENRLANQRGEIYCICTSVILFQGPKWSIKLFKSKDILWKNHSKSSVPSKIIKECPFFLRAYCSPFGPCKYCFATLHGA